MNKQNLKKVENSFFIDADYEQAFRQLHLTSIESVFSFKGGTDLAKKNLAGYRSRVKFETGSPAKTLFLKRYDKPPLTVQIKNRLRHRRRRSCAFFDFQPAKELAQTGINTPKTVCFGEQWCGLFEKRSFIVTEEIPEAQSLEKKLPDCFYAPPAAENIAGRRSFITRLAKFIKKFHDTGYRHRDLYLCHIFCDSKSEFHLIDLARAFKPTLFATRYMIKDLAQLYYSSPGAYISKTDRLRFYLAYRGRTELSARDRSIIRRIKSKAGRMARHDRRHGKKAPFQTNSIEL